MSTPGWSFSERVSGGSSETVVKDPSRDGRIRKVTARIYEGAQLDLELQIQKVTESGNTVQIIDPIGKSVIDGDDDAYEWIVNIPFSDMDSVQVVAENTDPNNAYDYRVNMDVSYEGGADMDLLNALAGVFD